MSISKHQIKETELETRTRDLMSRGEYPTLKKYLITAIASGRLSTRLQARAYFELGQAHLQLDEPVEAKKAFRSATDIRTHQTKPQR